MSAKPLTREERTPLAVCAAVSRTKFSPWDLLDRFEATVRAAEDRGERAEQRLETETARRWHAELDAAGVA